MLQQKQARKSQNMRVSNIPKRIINFLYSLDSYETLLRKEKKRRKAHYGLLGQEIVDDLSLLMFTRMDDQLGRSKKGQHANVSVPVLI